MRCRRRILVRGVQDSLLQSASAARSFAIAFGGVCEKLCAGTSTNCEKAFGSCSLPDAKLRRPAIACWKMNGCASQGALLFCSDARTNSFCHSPLSVHAFAVAVSAVRPRFRLPIYPVLFEIFSGSGRDAWRRPRNLAWIKASCALPTLGWIWVRPRATAPGRRISG